MNKKTLMLSLALASALNAEQITSIEYVNLTKISTKIANEVLDVKIGDELDPQKINQAIKEFYKYNYFDDITANIDNGKLQMMFTEKPSVANVDIIGYKQREDDIDLLKSQIGIKRGKMYSTKLVKDAKDALLKALEKEGYINSVVEVDIEKLNENAVSVTFSVNKGDEIVIKKVNYFGAEQLNESDFEKVTANKQEDFASWFITQNDGELKAEELDYDGKRIKELYLQNGYLDANVKNPFLEVDFLSNQAELDFYIEEGSQYKINDITVFVNSDIIAPEKIYQKLSLKKGRVFDINTLRKDNNLIKTIISDLGYAFAQVNFDIKKDKENGLANIIFNVIPGEQVFINDVKISGNSRTLDRVIRRNVYLAHGDLFSLTDYKDSLNKLRRSGYFDKVVINQKRVSATKMDLLIDVEETATGNIILGGGYGSADGMMVNASINEKNLFGSGIGFSFSGEIAESSQDFTMKFTNPSIGDSSYSGFIDIHSTENEINNTAYYLTKLSKGFSIGLGKEIVRNLRAGINYRFDQIEETYVYNDEYVDIIDDADKYQDTDYITSSITPYISFDNTNDYYFPTSGFKAGSSLEFAGVGGDSKYLKSSSYFKYFYSLEDRYDLDWVLRYKLQAKFLVDNGQINQGDSLYLGGTKSLRGFKSYAFPSNETGIKHEPYKAMAATSIEASFPLIPDSKMRWGLFYDIGIIGQDDFSDANKTDTDGTSLGAQRSSVGALFEWISPFGPLQLIFAQPLDDEATDDTSNFEFSLGSTF